MTEENPGGLQEGTKASMDNGYFDGPNLQYLEEKGRDGYIPDSKQAQEIKGKKFCIQGNNSFVCCSWYLVRCP